MKERNTKHVLIRPLAAGHRSETVRRANLSAIARELHFRGPLSRSDLVARTGLTRSAIRGLIGEFVAADAASEERAEPLGTPGRPSPLVRLNPERAVVLGLEITVDSLAAAVVGLGGAVLELVRVDRPVSRLSVAETVADLADVARRAMSSRPPGEEPFGIGVAIVGVVRRSDGFVSFAPNLGWRDVPLGELLAVALATDVPIAIANDADVGALAEHRRGTAIGAGHVLFLMGEVGVGGGLIVDGQPLTGAAGYGGEVGHIPINPAGHACRCGSLGCWETEVGERALLVRAGRRPDGGRAAIDAVLAEAEAGGPAAGAAVAETGHWMAIGLAGLINVFNPQLVVLGGLFGRLHPFVQRRLEADLDQLVLDAPRRLVTIVPATLGSDAPVLGAAELAFEPFLAEPAAWLRDYGNSRQLASA